MKLLIIHNDYLVPGGERFAVQAEVDLLRSKGHELIFYSRSNEETLDYDLLSKILLFPRVAFSLDTYNDTRSLINNYQPDVAHIHNVFPLISPSVYYALHHERIPIVQTIHNFRFMCPNGLFFTAGSVCERCKFGNTLHAIQWKCYRNSYFLSGLYAALIGGHRLINTFRLIDIFIVLSHFSKNKLVDSGIASTENIHVLGNYLRTPSDDQHLSAIKQTYFVFMGRLSIEKGLKTLLDAMQKLPQEKLYVLGEGPEKEDLLAYAAGLGLKNVEFLGFVTGEKKDSMLKNASALILPSSCYENFPLSVLESYSVGTPVIASNLGSIPELVIDGESGLLFTPGDSNELYEKMHQLLTNPSESLRLGNNAFHQMVNYYSPDIHYQKLLNIYEQCITKS